MFNIYMTHMLGLNIFIIFYKYCVLCSICCTSFSTWHICFAHLLFHFFWYIKSFHFCSLNIFLVPCKLLLSGLSVAMESLDFLHSHHYMKCICYIKFLYNRDWAYSVFAFLSFVVYHFAVALFSLWPNM